MVQSKSYTARFPSGFIDYIDERLVDTGRFSSRADFVYCAMRYYFDGVLFKFAMFYDSIRTEMDNNPDYIKEMKKFGTSSMSLIKRLTLNVNLIFDTMSYFQGEMKPVLVRMPQTLFDDIKRFIKETDIFEDIPDFVTHAVLYYADAVNYQMSISDAIHHRDKDSILFMFKDSGFKYYNLFVGNHGTTQHPVNEMKSDKEDWLD